MFSREDIFNSELPIKKELLKLFKKDGRILIFDIGGCEGEDSLRYAKVFTKASIFVFEPLPQNQKLIEENLRRHNASNIQLFPIALSDEEGVVDFYVSSGQPDIKADFPDWDFGNKSSSLLSPSEVLQEVSWLRFDSKIKVTTRTLNNFMTENGLTGIDFVHMDVQGAELKVLQGAGLYLKNIKVIWLEVAESKLYREQPLRKEVEAFMHENGFYLTKTQLEGNSGDQLYINTRYYDKINFFGVKIFRKK